MYFAADASKNWASPGLASQRWAISAPSSRRTMRPLPARHASRSGEVCAPQPKILPIGPRHLAATATATAAAAATDRPVDCVRRLFEMSPPSAAPDVLVTKRPQRAHENASKETLWCCGRLICNAVDGHQRTCRQFRRQQFDGLVDTAARTDAWVLIRTCPAPCTYAIGKGLQLAKACFVRASKDFTFLAVAAKSSSVN